MNATSTILSSGYRIIVFVSCLVSATWSAQAEQVPATAVFSEISRDYHRVILPSGRYEPETYAFGEGLCVDMSENDKSLNTLSFREIATIMAESLAKVDFVPTPGAKDTDLLIVINWGLTMPLVSGPEDQTLTDLTTSLGEFMVFRQEAERAMNDKKPNEEEKDIEEKVLMDSVLSSYENEMDQTMALYRIENNRRMEANLRNARLLGFHEAMKWAEDLARTSFTLLVHKDDLLLELECPRYFVILQAYDFPKMWKEKKKVLLWTTRFSIRAKGRRFDEELQNMALAASPVFGSDTDLKRGLRPPEVKLGELEYIGVVEDEN